MRRYDSRRTEAPGHRSERDLKLRSATTSASSRTRDELIDEASNPSRTMHLTVVRVLPRTLVLTSLQLTLGSGAAAPRSPFGRTGPVGPRGPAVPVGPVEPAGPAGPTSKFSTGPVAALVNGGVDGVTIAPLTRSAVTRQATLSPTSSAVSV